MNTGTVLTEFETRATEALKALLGRVSAIKLRDLERVSPPRARFAAILAHIEVFGHSHILACEVDPEVDPYGEPDQLRAMLRELQVDAASLASGATPVLIAPYLSPEAQAICKQSHVGFLDLEGNARLSVGEVFIGIHSHPRGAASQPSATLHASPAGSAVSSSFRKGLPNYFRKHAEAALPA
jgi:hypothetical protein